MSFKLTPAEGSTQNRKRIGRGNASGQGRTAGKGHNGYKSRSGTKAKLHFEVDGMKSIDEISLDIEKIIKFKN